MRIRLETLRFYQIRISNTTIRDCCRFLFRFLTVNSYKKDPKTSRFFFIHTSISLIIEVKNVAIGSKISFFKSIFKTIQSLARDKHITAKNNISPELVKFSRALVARSSPVTPKFFSRIWRILSSPTSISKDQKIITVQRWNDGTSLK